MIPLNDLNKHIAKELNVDEIYFMEDTFNESGLKKEIIEEREVNYGWFLFPRYRTKKIKHTFYAKNAVFRKNGKVFGITIPPQINNLKYDTVSQE